VTTTAFERRTHVYGAITIVATGRTSDGGSTEWDAQAFFEERHVRTVVGAPSEKQAISTLLGELERLGVALVGAVS
jgi:hypothetical protein